MVRATFDKGAKVKRWERNLDNPSAALRQIGILLVAESKQAFREQRFGNVAWPERKTPNIFGIIADFHQGRRSPPQRRFESRPALMDTGRLAASVSFRVVSSDTVEAGSNLDYAGVLHKGGEVESLPITGTVRQGLWHWLRNQDKDLKKQIGWLLNKKFEGETIKATVPARPIVGLTTETIRDINETIGVKIMEVQG